MSLSGKVLKIEHNQALVEVAPRPECSQCQVCSGLLAKEKSLIQQIIVNTGLLEIQEGDEVDLEPMPGVRSAAALILFGIPIVGFFLGLFLGQPLFASMGFHCHEWQSFFGAICGTVLSFLLNAFLARANYFKTITLNITSFHRN